jgi:hypothetical protein
MYKPDLAVVKLVHLIVRKLVTVVEAKRSGDGSIEKDEDEDERVEEVGTQDQLKDGWGQTLRLVLIHHH